MYDNYTRYIYEWLQSSGLADADNLLSSILTKADNLLTILTYILYAALFFGFFWICKKFLLNILFA